MTGWSLSAGIRSLLGQTSAESATGSTNADSRAMADGAPVASVPEGIWSNHVPVAARKTLPPDPRVMQTIGLNHSFESAVADIVDNSIDAGAKKVLIRFVRNSASLIGLCILDDGRGMDDTAIDRAMTVGGRRDYNTTELGHFGIGLKAASLGQARVLTVISRASGCPAVGRRWFIETASKGFECDVLGDDFCASTLDREWAFVAPSTGTLVMWTEVKSFPKLSSGDSIDRFFDSTSLRLRHHLGLVFHRLIASGTISIGVDVEDVGVGAGPVVPVEPIDPFGYVRSARRDYPKLLAAPWRDGSMKFRCHIWPGRSNLPNFKLSTTRPEQHQGFFIYRNQRLLQLGGWNGVVPADRDLLLARVEVDVSADHADLFPMNAEKTRVDPAPQFADMMRLASDGKTSFLDYLEVAKQTYRDSQKRRRERPRVVRPGQGFSPKIRSSVAEEYEFLPGDQGLDIRWSDLDDDVFFDIDRDNMLIKINRHYRSSITGGKGSLNDAPLVKALVYLLAEEAFRGTNLGPTVKDALSVWQNVLTVAAREENK